MAQPPRSNPFPWSTSVGPFPCITPRTLTCVMVVSFMLVVPSSSSDLVDVSPLLRQPPPRSDTAPGNSAEDLPVAGGQRFDNAAGFGATALHLLMHAQCGRTLGPDGQRRS